MRRFKVLGLTVMALFALGAFASSSALALPTFLPTGSATEPVLVEGSAGKGVLETAAGLAIKCGSVTILADFESASLGTFHLHFKECVNSAGEKCETPSDETGVILVLGEFHLVYDSLSPTLGVALLLLIPQFHINCLGLLKPLLLIVGNILILIENPGTTLKPPIKLIVKQTKGVPADRHWWNDTPTEQTAKLETKINEGAFEESGVEQEKPELTKFKHDPSTEELKSFDLHEV